MALTRASTQLTTLEVAMDILAAEDFGGHVLSYDSWVSDDWDHWLVCRGCFGRIAEHELFRGWPRVLGESCPAMLMKEDHK